MKAMNCLNRFCLAAVLIASLAGVGALGQSSSGKKIEEHLSLCSKCLNPTITSMSGIGTANAVAEAKITRKEAEGWCANWEPNSNLATCVKQQLASEDPKKIYRAAADCTKGRITAIDGQTYTYAGTWDSDVGRGRSKWRDASGAVVGQDNASNGLAISQQWEVLCPASTGRTAGSSGSIGGSGRGNTPEPGSSRQPGPAQGGRGPICGGQAFCTEVNNFAATVTDFRASLDNATKVLTATIGFQNKTDHPIRLGYILRSGAAIDERNNRYVSNDYDVRGIGLINGGSVDDKFVLDPHQGSDARFTFAWRAGRAVYGTTFEIQITVREILPAGINQLKLGAEFPLRFNGLNHRAMGGVSSPGPGRGAGPGVPPRQPNDDNPRPQLNHCPTPRNCMDAGPFTATVVGLTGGVVTRGRDHITVWTVAFKNVTDHELILGYKAGSNTVSDSLNNPYFWGRPSTYDGSARGIGIVIPGRSADTTFRLAPGEARNAQFTLIRYNTGAKPVGQSFTLDTVIVELRIYPNGKQSEIVREYSVHLPDVRLGTRGASAAPDSAPCKPGSVCEKLQRVAAALQKNQ